MRLAYVTAGDVGAGHLARGVAIKRALARRGYAGELAMLGPALPYPAASARREYRAVRIAREELEDPLRAKDSALAHALAELRPELLLVDLFWAPLRYVLPLPGCEAWLLARICPPPWFAGPPKAPFEPAHYARVIGIEPDAHPAVREHIEPIVIANPDERRPRGALRARLGLAEGEPLHAVVHAGARGEREELERDARARHPAPRVLDLFEASALFPLAEWLSDVDSLTAAAGYNTYWEAKWLGYADRARFRSFPRRIDAQAKRVATGSSHVMRENGADVLARWIAP